ncbi:MAG TPA: flagellin [Dongiaceae bacterium]|nr:flagellin [Dongiaceae bacterium]
MASNNIQLTSGIRSNLLLLQQTTSLMDRTQQRLSTGNKINSALDGPVSYFAARGLTQRSDDLNLIKDQMDQSVSTIKAANTAITQIQTFIDQLKGDVTQAQSNLGSDPNSVALRKKLADDYNTVLRQIDKLAQDSTYQGKNLLVGSGLTLDATSSSKSAVNAITGISDAQTTNVTALDNYVVNVSGTGAIGANATDIAQAEQDRGISNLSISGFQSKTNGNFDPVTVKYSGGVGKDKTFTVTENGVSVSKTFTVQQWNNAKATGQVLTFDGQFASGTHINFDVNFDDIDNVPDTNGIGSTTIEKLVDLNVSVTDFNGIGQTITRSASNLLGQQKLANGQNAWGFDTGTARLNIDERKVLGASGYPATIGQSYGTAAGAIVGTPVISADQIATDATYALTAAADPANFDFALGRFTTYSATLTGPGGANTQAITAGGSTTFTSVGNGAAPLGSALLNIRPAGLNGVTVASASDATQADATETIYGAALSAGAVSLTSLGGLADNLAHTLTYTVTAGTGTSGVITLSDGYGGKTQVSISLQGGAVPTSINLTLAGGVNNGAQVTLTLGSSYTIAPNTNSTIVYHAIGKFTGVDQSQFDVRTANTSQTATMSTTQTTDGTDSNNMTVQLNETNTTLVTVVSQDVQTDGQGLQIDQAQNGWLDRADIAYASQQLDAATIKLRSAAASLGTSVDIITTRLDYTKDFTNVLQEGAGKLTLADQNEEGANMLQLQTRQQLGTISLSLANQAQQAILKLF